MNFVKTYASVTDAGFIKLGVFYDLYMLKRDYFVAIVGTAQWSLKLASWLIDVNYILVPDNNCDQKFKGTDHLYPSALFEHASDNRGAPFRPRRGR